MTETETSPKLMQGSLEVSDFPPPPAARSLTHSVDIGLHLLPGDSFEKIRAHLGSLVDIALMEAAFSIGAGELPSDFLEGAHVTLRFAP